MKKKKEFYSLYHWKSPATKSGRRKDFLYGIDWHLADTQLDGIFQMGVAQICIWLSLRKAPFGLVASR